MCLSLFTCLGTSKVVRRAGTAPAALASGHSMVVVTIQRPIRSGGTPRRDSAKARFDAMRCDAPRCPCHNLHPEAENTAQTLMARCRAVDLEAVKPTYLAASCLPACMRGWIPAPGVSCVCHWLGCLVGVGGRRCSLRHAISAQHILHAWDVSSKAIQPWLPRPATLYSHHGLPRGMFTTVPQVPSRIPA